MGKTSKKLEFVFDSSYYNHKFFTFQLHWRPMAAFCFLLAFTTERWNSMGLHIRKSQQKDEWILYNPDSFDTCHTHCRHKRVAVKIKYLVEHHIVPESKDLRFVDSCIRVTKNKIYLTELRKYRESIEIKELP